MKRYHVALFDVAGEFAREEFEVVEDAARQAGEWARDYPRKVLQVTDYNGADYDCDGLTDEDRDVIDAAIDAATMAVRA